MLTTISIIIIILSGYLGQYIDQTGQFGQLGKLLWLIVPFFVSVFNIRKQKINISFLKPSFRFWYLPLTIVFVSILNILMLFLFGQAKINNSNIDIPFIATNLLTYFVLSFIEEFTWRGFLQNKFNQITNGNYLVTGTIVGILWYLWHIPYIPVLISPFINNYGFAYYTLPIATVVMSILLAFINTKNNTVWYPIIFHTLYNTIALIAINVISMDKTIIFSPILVSFSFIFSMIIILCFIYFSVKNTKTD